MSTPPKSSQLPNLIGLFVDGGQIFLKRKLGNGAYGHCYEARSRNVEDPPKCAVKVMVKATDERSAKFQRTEIESHALVSDHPNVVTLYRYFEEQINGGPVLLFLLMDLYEGDMFHALTSEHLYVGQESRIRSVFAQLASAIQYCHEKGVCHRDLKPENIMVADGGDRLLIGDFGLATFNQTSTEFGCGSKYYMSPECLGVFGRVPFDPRPNDIWALGIIFVNLVCGRNPWNLADSTDSTFLKYAQQGGMFLREMLPLSYATVHFLGNFFALRPKNRLKAKDIIAAMGKVTKFEMSHADLRDASPSCRAAARDMYDNRRKAIAIQQQRRLPKLVIEPVVHKELRRQPLQRRRVTAPALVMYSENRHRTESPSEQVSARPPPSCSRGSGQESSLPSFLEGSTGSSAADDFLPTPEQRAVDGSALPNIQEAEPLALQDNGIAQQPPVRASGVPYKASQQASAHPKSNLPIRKHARASKDEIVANAKIPQIASPMKFLKRTKV